MAETFHLRNSVSQANRFVNLFYCARGPESEREIFFRAAGKAGCLEPLNKIEGEIKSTNPGFEVNPEFLKTPSLKSSRKAPLKAVFNYEIQSGEFAKKPHGFSGRSFARIRAEGIKAISRKKQQERIYMFKKNKKQREKNASSLPAGAAETRTPRRERRGLSKWFPAARRRNLTGRQAFLIIGLTALLTLGVLGAAAGGAGNTSGESNKGKQGFFSWIAETLGFGGESEPAASDAANPPPPELKLSKEYVYAGSRMLAVEDYGVAPTPSPTATPTPTPSPTPTPPAAPTSVTTTVVSSTQINVFWNASQSQNVTSYNLRVNGTQVLTGITYLSFPVTQLTAGTNYTFEVQAVDSANGLSNWTSPVGATTLAPPTTPTITAADVISSTQINVYWSTPPPGETVAGYNVRMNGSQVLTGFIYASYPFGSLTPNTQYTFQVQAVDPAGGLSGWSQSVSATTAP